MSWLKVWARTILMQEWEAEKADWIRDRRQLVAALNEEQRTVGRLQAELEKERTSASQALRDFTDYLSKVHFGIGCFSGQTLPGPRTTSASADKPVPIGRTRARALVEEQTQQRVQEDARRQRDAEMEKLAESIGAVGLSNPLSVSLTNPTALSSTVTEDLEKALGLE